MHSAIRPGAAAIGVALSLAAHAGRPLQTDDAGVLDPAACEIEAFAARLGGAGASAREQVLQAGCGVGGRTQLALASSRSHADGGRARGLELNGKTRLWHGQGREGEAPALTLGYAIGWLRAGDTGWRHAATLASLLYTHPLPADLALHATLGHARDTAARADATTWGLALEHAGFGALAPMAELFGDDRAPPWWNLGLRWNAVPDLLFIDVSHGRQFAPGTPRLTTLGIKLAF